MATVLRFPRAIRLSPLPNARAAAAPNGAAPANPLPLVLPDSCWWAVAEEWTGSTREQLAPFLAPGCREALADFRLATLVRLDRGGAPELTVLLRLWRPRELHVGGLDVRALDGARLEGAVLRVRRGGAFLLFEPPLTRVLAGACAREATAKVLCFQRRGCGRNGAEKP